MVAVPRLAGRERFSVFMPPLADILLSAVFVAATVAESLFSDTTRPPLVHAVITAPVMALLAWRRRLPLATAAALVAAVVATNPDGHFSTLLALVLVSFTCGAERDPPRSWIGLAIVTVPFFALMSAGVAVSGGLSLFSDPVFLGVVVGLVVGKPVGVLAGAWLATRVTRAELSPELSWRDVAGVAVLAGVGFTVALLVAELSFGGQEADNAKAAILFGSLTAALLAAVLLRRRSRVRAES